MLLILKCSDWSNAPKKREGQKLVQHWETFPTVDKNVDMFCTRNFFGTPRNFYFNQQPFLWDINLFFWSFRPNSLKNIYIYFLAKPILSLFFHLQIQLLKAQQLNMVPYRQGREVIISGGKIGLGQGQQSQPWHLGHPGTVLIIHIQLSFR